MTAAFWRPMTGADIDACNAIGDTIFPDHPEPHWVMPQRLALFPEGCMVLEADGGRHGYVVAHPAVFGHPPRLGEHLAATPPAPTSLHLHDICLLPAVRGAGHSATAIGELEVVALRLGLPRLCLIAIGGRAPFWRRHGFEPATIANPAILASYDAEAVYLSRPLSPPSSATA